MSGPYVVGERAVYSRERIAQNEIGDFYIGPSRRIRAVTFHKRTNKTCAVHVVLTYSLMGQFFQKGSAVLASIAMLAAIQCAHACSFGECAPNSSYSEAKNSASECHQHRGQPSNSKSGQSKACSHDLQSDKIERAIEKSVRFTSSNENPFLDAAWSNSFALCQPQYSVLTNLKTIPPLIGPLKSLTTIIRV